MYDLPTSIGVVESVAGNTISIKLNEAYPSGMPIINGIVYRIGQIGSFLQIPLGYAKLYGVVTKTGTSAIPEHLLKLYKEDPTSLSPSRWLTMVLVGEQIGNNFERGVLQSPTTGDSVHLVTIEDLVVVYGLREVHKSISVGNISASENLDAKIDVDKLLSRHGAILGSTGSGKSNAVTVLLQALATADLPSARILVIDPHGEYNDALSKHSSVFKIGSDPSKGERELFVPFWALPFDELMGIFPGSINDQQKDYVRSKVYELKLKNLPAYPGVRKESITADSPIPFSIRQLWFELDDFERQTYEKVPSGLILAAKVSMGSAEELRPNEYPPAGTGSSPPFLNNSRKGILSYLDGLRTRLLDKRYSFLFDDATCIPKSYEYGAISRDLDLVFSDWLGNENPISIIDLSGIPSEIMQAISGALLKIVYDAVFWGQLTSVGGKEQPLYIVLEEAHNYIKQGDASVSSRTVQMIAKEGRKYGVGLLLVTQRPSEIDETVLSQCGTFIALRMNNQRDRGHISGAMQDDLQSMSDILSSLRTGEAIVTGEAVKIPSRIKFYRAPYSAVSSDPKASQKWRSEKPDNANYIAVLRNWRNQSF